MRFMIFDLFSYLPYLSHAFGDIFLTCFNVFYFRSFFLPVSVTCIAISDF